MPQSKKRKVEKKQQTVEQKHVNVGGNLAGKILITVLCVGMVLGLVVAAVFLMIQSFK